MNADLLAVRGLSKSFGRHRVLNDVSLVLHRGETHGLVGENGAGKSTLLNLITGVLLPDAGEIEFEGVKVTGLQPALARKLGIAVVHQELSLCSELSIAENIFLGNEPRTRLGVIDYKKMCQDAEAACGALNLHVDVHQKVRSLPLAEQQMVEIAKALIMHPKLLILDEATSALGQEQVALLFEQVRALKAAGVSTIIVSHRLKEIITISDRVTVLKDGSLVTTTETSAVGENDLIRLMVGRNISDLFPPKPVSAQVARDQVVLSVRDLSAGRCFKNLSFDLYKGEILGLGGLKGQGQEELMKALFGIIRASGSVTVLDRRYSAKSPLASMRQGLAYLPEERKTAGLLLPLSIRFNMTLSSLHELSYRLGTVDRRREDGLVQQLMKKLGVAAESAEQTVGTLSGGNQQKVAIAKWLGRKPSIFLLDEPTRGIDVGTKREIYFLLRELADSGVSILLISSETIELVGLCDRVLVMFEGCINKELTGGEITEENIVRASVLAEGSTPGVAS